MSGTTTPVPATPTPPAATTWGAMTVTILIFAAYFAWVAIAYLLKLDNLYGSLSELPKQGVMIALGYWLGSSRGSADKSAATPSTPFVVAAPVGTTGAAAPLSAQRRVAPVTPQVPVPVVPFPAPPVPPTP